MLCDQIWIPEREDEEPVHECALRDAHAGPHVCDCGVQIEFLGSGARGSTVHRPREREWGMSDLVDGLREMHDGARPCGTTWPHAMHIYPGGYCAGVWATNGLNSTQPTDPHTSHADGIQ